MFFLYQIQIFKLWKVIMKPVFSWDDVAYKIYETAGHTASVSIYGRDVYNNALDFFSNTMSFGKTISVY